MSLPLIIYVVGASFFSGWQLRSFNAVSPMNQLTVRDLVAMVLKSIVWPPFLVLELLFSNYGY